MRPKNRNEFTTAIICALPLEADAVEALFDKTYDRLSQLYGKHPQDRNTYINGRIGNHDVVLCCMSGMGKETAASVATILPISYPSIQIALVVGVCGGITSLSSGRNIYLGDVVISDSMVVYDFGRQYPGGFRRKANVKDTLGRPNQEIRSLLTALNASRSRSDFQQKISQNLHGLQQREPRWKHPGLDDLLFKASYIHKHHAKYLPTRCCCSSSNSPYEICDEASEMECNDLRCAKNKVVRRRSSTTITTPSIHIGTIASADTVMKSGEHRDVITKMENVIGFEMEGAGVWDNIPCIIIKGVCDYADSHKSKMWQCYAAATGASAAKALLQYWKPPGQYEMTINNEIDHLQSLSLGYAKDDRGPRSQQAPRENTLKENSQKGSVLLDGLNQTHETALSPVPNEKTLGAVHEDTPDGLYRLGKTLNGQERYGEAERTFRRLFDRRRQALGGYHKDTLDSLHWLGKTINGQKRYSVAEAEFREVWQMRKRALGTDHQDTLNSLYWLGQALNSQEKFGEAEDAFRELWQRREVTLGELHKDTAHALDLLEAAYKSQGNGVSISRRCF